MVECMPEETFSGHLIRLTECNTLIKDQKYLIWKLNNVKSKPFGIRAIGDVVVLKTRANEGKRWSKACLKKLFIFTQDRSSHRINGLVEDVPCFCDLLKISEVYHSNSM